MQITEQIIERIARRTFNSMFASALRQSNVVTSGAGSSVSWADNAGHADSADSASTAGTASAAPWTGITGKPATATRWPAWSEVTDKPDVAIQAAHNNLLAAGNEFTFASSGFSGGIWLNYRTAGGLNGAITGYTLGDGAGHALGTIIHSGNISSQSVNYANSAGSATKATQDGDGNVIKNTYLKLSGGTMTGALTLKDSQYAGYMTGSSRTYAMNANNSDIVGINALIMSDKSDGWTESFGFPRDGSDAGHYDTFRAANGTFYFGFNGYFDSSNVEHAAAEIVTITGGAIQLARQDANNANLRVKNTSRDISLGVGSTNCGVYYQTGSKWIIGTDGSNTWLSTGNVGIGTVSPSQKLHVSGGLAAITNNSRTVTIGAQNSTGIHIYNDNSSPFFFNGDVCSNASKTYDLGSSTYPWGTLYAAGCNIYDTSPSVHVGTSSSARISLHWSSDSNRGLYDYTGTWVVATNGTNTFMMKGNVGIGTTAPAYKLDVNGVIYSNTGVYSAGYVTALSDARKKDVLGDVELSAEQIAEMPAVRFSWIDQTKPGIFIGTLAQPWQKLLPEAVRTMADGVLSFDYQSAAMVSVINLAREVAAIKSKLKRYGFK